MHLIAWYSAVHRAQPVLDEDEEHVIWVEQLCVLGQEALDFLHGDFVEHREGLRVHWIVNGKD